MTSITLREFDCTDVVLSDDTARALITVAKDRLRVGVGSGPGSFRIESMQYVGSVVVPGASVLIRPKVPIENVFLLLEAVVEPEWQADEFEWETSGGLLPAFASFFARTLERTVSRGLYRAYRTEEDWIPALRGRLDLNAQFRQPGIAVPVPCRYDEFTADVIENQTLKAALVRLARTAGISPAVRQRLRRLRSAFDEVSDVDVDPDIVDRLHVHRLNRPYVPALRLAQLVLRNLTLTDQIGERRASCFLVDMNLLFQRFVTARLRRLLRTRLDVEAEPIVHLARGRRVAMEPDLVFKRNGRAVFVGDTKYKILGNQLGRGSDYYQMLAYTTALDLPDGVLIYCTADGPQPDRQIEVIGADTRLWTYPLDVSGSAASVHESLTALAEWILDHVPARALPLAG